MQEFILSWRLHNDFFVFIILKMLQAWRNTILDSWIIHSSGLLHINCAKVYEWIRLMSLSSKLWHKQMQKKLWKTFFGLVWEKILCLILIFFSKNWDSNIVSRTRHRGFCLTELSLFSILSSYSAYFTNPLRWSLERALRVYFYHCQILSFRELSPFFFSFSTLYLVNFRGSVLLWSYYGGRFLQWLVRTVVAVGLK